MLQRFRFDDYWCRVVIANDCRLFVNPLANLFAIRYGCSVPGAAAIAIRRMVRTYAGLHDSCDPGQLTRRPKSHLPQRPNIDRAIGRDAGQPLAIR